MAANTLQVRKRDGRIVPWDESRMATAIRRAMQDTQFCAPDAVPDPEHAIQKVVAIASKGLAWKYLNHHQSSSCGIEEIQDAIEEALIMEELPHTAKSYILYRQQRAEARNRITAQSNNEDFREVRELAELSSTFFSSSLSEFIYYRSYSRWREEWGRREVWLETVDRYMAFMKENLGERLTGQEYTTISLAIARMEVMPSMRLMWSAGEFARANPAAAYNCSFLAIQSIRDFAELMFLCMSGCGVGFGCESQFIEHLPVVVNPKSVRNLPVHKIDDTRESWCDALALGMETWFNGEDITWDFSAIRPRGSRLRVTGGRASGPEPLRQLLHFTRDRIRSRRNRRLRPIDVHDICCKIGDIATMSDMRRTALISISDLDDPGMREAKYGSFWEVHPYRANANNSVVYDEKPSAAEFMEEWLALVKSGTGERGIFNRQGMRKYAPERRNSELIMGLNPCGEIVLRNKQFCNLTEAVMRPDDGLEETERKIRIAAIIGTYQSMLTNFTYLGPEWKKNCDEERLLGVSMTGVMDNRHLITSKFGPDTALLSHLRKVAVQTNCEFADRFGTPHSRAVTCIKPSGTVSQLVGSSSGIHARHSQHYIRRVRIAATDPLFKMLRDQGMPYQPEVGDDINTYVLEFPVKSPPDAVLRKHLSAKDQFNIWRAVREFYTEHNPSVTINVKDEEWVEIGAAVYADWDKVGGLSFLPYSNHGYKLAPYEAIDESYYNRMVEAMPKIDWSMILQYEKEDSTTGAQELACQGGQCELI